MQFFSDVNVNCVGTSYYIHPSYCFWQMTTYIFGGRGTIVCENENWDNKWIIGTVIISIGSEAIISTHWGRDKMTAILHTTFSNAFSWMKLFAFRLKFHWSLFPRVLWTRYQNWFRLWPNRREAIIWINADLCCPRIYTSLGLHELPMQDKRLRDFNERVFQQSVPP